MTNYVKATSFASKDALATGNPLKIVKGTEIDAEFNSIAVAVETKADLLTPTFTGTPFVPTATYGTNSAQIASTAFVTAALQLIYPVGSIYTNASVATNPATLIGFGTWTAFGTGKVLVGLNGADGSFNSLGQVGGSKDATLPSHTHGSTSSGTTSSENAAHSHGFSGSTGGAGAHDHYVGSTDSTAGVGGSAEQEFIRSYNAGNGALSYTNPVGDHAHGFSGNTGTESAAHQHTVSVSGTTNASGVSPTNTNLQPYVVVNMWLRTS